jgi:hypothetical protein
VEPSVGVQENLWDYSLQPLWRHQVELSDMIQANRISLLAAELNAQLSGILWTRVSGSALTGALLLDSLFRILYYPNQCHDFTSSDNLAPRNRKLISTINASSVPVREYDTLADAHFGQVKTTLYRFGVSSCCGPRQNIKISGEFYGAGSFACSANLLAPRLEPQ